MLCYKTAHPPDVPSRAPRGCEPYVPEVSHCKRLDGKSDLLKFITGIKVIVSAMREHRVHDLRVLNITPVDAILGRTSGDLVAAVVVWDPHARYAPICIPAALTYALEVIILSTCAARAPPGDCATAGRLAAITPACVHDGWRVGRDRKLA